jgi:hypothetical protein
VPTKEELEQLTDAILRRLELPTVELAMETFDVAITRCFPQVELEEEAMRDSIAFQLVDRLRPAIDKNAGGRRTVGIVRAKLRYEDNDEGRCYEVVLRVAAEPIWENPG